LKTIPWVHRRRFLQAGLGSLLLPRWAQAQSEGAVQLLRRPKRALVIGNSAYRNGDTLRNPRNDAAAIADALSGMGFQVNTLIDAERAAMTTAIRSHVAALNAEKSVGLFYYAGHGVQLAWRNYLLPVDVDLKRVEDIPAQCVDASDFIGGLARAGNPMNVIILDACRNNPFLETPPEQKGLSQMDAPPSTLLAYATAPGHLASDGRGKNGLYTENLLRELRVRDAKIEDVFKRVRLGVRRASGARRFPGRALRSKRISTSSRPKTFASSRRRKRRRNSRRSSRSTSSRSLPQRWMRSRPTCSAIRADGSRNWRRSRWIPCSPRAERSASNRFAAKAIPLPGHGPRGHAIQGGRHVCVSANRNGTFRRGARRLYRHRHRHYRGRSGDERWRGRPGPPRQHDPHPGRHQFTPRQDQPLEYAVGRHWTTSFLRHATENSTGDTIQDFRIVGREMVTVPAERSTASRWT
jgi:hypothetical protein